MSRGFSDCCHYDDGYDEGYEDGKSETGGDSGIIASALRLIARERFVYGEEGEADLLERVASEIERDPFLEDKLRHEKERQVEIVAEYAKQRRAVAA